MPARGNGVAPAGRRSIPFQSRFSGSAGVGAARGLFSGECVMRPPSVEWAAPAGGNPACHRAEARAEGSEDIDWSKQTNFLSPHITRGPLKRRARVHCSLQLLVFRVICDNIA